MIICNPSLHNVLTQRDIKTEKNGCSYIGRVTYDHLLPLHKRQCLVTIIFTILPLLLPLSFHEMIFILVYIYSAGEQRELYSKVEEEKMMKKEEA